MGRPGDTDSYRGGGDAPSRLRRTARRTAQGANLGSHTAFALAELITQAHAPFDEEFCRSTTARLWEHARHVVEWSNAFLAPAPPHVAALFGQAAQDKRVADAFVSKFNDPVAMWAILSTPEGVTSFVADCLQETQSPAMSTTECLRSRMSSEAKEWRRS